MSSCLIGIKAHIVVARIELIDAVIVKYAVCLNGMVESGISSLGYIGYRGTTAYCDQLAVPFIHRSLLVAIADAY